MPQTEALDFMPKHPQVDLIEPQYAMEKFKNDTIYLERCKAQARQWAKANRSDPNAYDRAMLEYATGIAYAGSPTGALFAGSQGYAVQWSQEPRVSFNGDEFYVQIPINMKRP